MKKILIVTRDPLVHFRQMKDERGITDDGQYQFVINDLDCEPDFVVIKEKGLRQPKRFHVPRSHTILLTGEPYSVLDYPKAFCSQFGTVLACQREVKAGPQTNVIYTQAILTWFVGATFEPDGTNRFPMNYEAIRRSQPKKDKLISVISSTKAFTQGHVDRLRFITKLQQRYGDKVDVFGRGFKPFSDKWDVLAPYKYHIVIENSSSDYYWTEKIADCYLAGTYPIYHGCTNIGNFFPEKALTPIDIRHFNAAADTIDRVISENLYEKRKAELEKSKELVLDKYNMFNFIAQTCKDIESKEAGISVPSPDAGTLINPASKYFSWHNLYLYTIGRNYYKLISKL